MPTSDDGEDEKALLITGGEGATAAPEAKRAKTDQQEETNEEADEVEAPENRGESSLTEVLFGSGADGTTNKSNSKNGESSLFGVQSRSPPRRPLSKKPASFEDEEQDSRDSSSEVQFISTSSPARPKPPPPSSKRIPPFHANADNANVTTLVHGGPETSTSKGGHHKLDDYYCDEDDYEDEDEDEYYGACDDDDDVDEYEEAYYQEEEGPDGLTASERLYLQREYEMTNLSEREWLIKQRQRRRIVDDNQARALSVCTVTVGRNGLMSVEQFDQSSPSALAARRRSNRGNVAAAAAAAAAATTTAARHAASTAYDQLNSDEEEDGECDLLRRMREKSLEVCTTLMNTMGVLLVQNDKRIHSTGRSGDANGEVGAASASAKNNSDSDVEILGTADRPPSDPIIPHDLMKELVDAARKIEIDLCRRLDEKGEQWRAVPADTAIEPRSSDSAGDNENKHDSGVVLDISEEETKMPSRETAAREQETRRKEATLDAAAETKVPIASETNFRYYEVASRCPGRIDVRYRMDCSPFNDPRIVSNPVILSIVKNLLGGEKGGCELVYAGLIFSFPGSSDQPWHMDGEALFPEQEFVELPPYAFNVFVPLDDVSAELGPTEFVPGTHTTERAQDVNETLLEWTMIQSRWTAAGDQKASMRMVLGAEEDRWMSKNSVVAPLLRRGDALIYDYRVCHRGTRNLSATKTRRMLYLMYARPWFKEHLNFGSERLFDDSNGPTTALPTALLAS